MSEMGMGCECGTACVVPGFLGRLLLPERPGSSEPERKQPGRNGLLVNSSYVIFSPQEPVKLMPLVKTESWTSPSPPSHRHSSPWLWERVCSRQPPRPLHPWDPRPHPVASSREALAVLWAPPRCSASSQTWGGPDFKGSTYSPEVGGVLSLEMSLFSPGLSIFPSSIQNLRPAENPLPLPIP